MTSVDRRPVTVYATLAALGVVAGGVQLATDADRTSAGAGVATANWIHVGLAVLTLAALAVARHRDRRALAGFLRYPFTGPGWAATADALLWRRGVLLLRPLRFLAALLLAYSPLRAGEQVLAALDPDFTRDAWGGPSYLGASAAHWLDGALIFYAAATVVRVAAARRVHTAAPAGQ
jgi:hypothetical protein